MRRERVLYVEGEGAGLTIEAGWGALLIPIIHLIFRRSPWEVAAFILERRWSYLLSKKKGGRFGRLSWRRSPNHSSVASLFLTQENEPCDLRIYVLNAEESKQNMSQYVNFFGGKEEETAHLAVPRKFWRKLTRSVYEERRTEPVKRAFYAPLE